MAMRDLHAVVCRGEGSGAWVAFCVEYDIASQGDSEQQALEMLTEAVELHLEDITPEQLEVIDNEVGSVPVIKRFSVNAPAILHK
jgi:predicted RNase H-like HicB family nuclease